MTLVAASARRHPLVPPTNERAIVWIVNERPLTDEQGRRYYRVMIDSDGSDYSRKDTWRKVYVESVELLSPELYPPRVVHLEHGWKKTRACRHCGSTLDVRHCGPHEVACRWPNVAPEGMKRRSI